MDSKDEESSPMLEQHEHEETKSPIVKKKVSETQVEGLTKNSLKLIFSLVLNLLLLIVIFFLLREIPSKKKNITYLQNVETGMWLTYFSVL